MRPLIQIFCGSTNGPKGGCIAVLRRANRMAGCGASSLFFLYAIRVTNDTVFTQDVGPYARIKLRLRKRRPDISLR